MKKITTRSERRERRRARVRATVLGTAVKPRLNVFRSLKGVFAQLIDDEARKTLVSVNLKELKEKKVDAGERKGKIAQSYAVGKMLGEKAKEKKIVEVVFDRAGYQYHGRVKALAEGARDAGLQF